MVPSERGRASWATPKASQLRLMNRPLRSRGTWQRTKEMTMRAPAKRSSAVVAVVAALGLGGAGIALASAGSDATPQSSTPATGGGAQSRLDDGKDLLPRANV